MSFSKKIQKHFSVKHSGTQYRTLWQCLHLDLPLLCFLLLLTFIENAFKHGVTQELETATIDINISSEGNQIVFSIKNSKPNAVLQTKNGQCIGLENVKKQLKLIYPNQYDLTIDNTKNEYIVNLKLATK